MEKFIKDQVKSGLYSNASEVAREAFRAMIMQKKQATSKWPADDGTIWPAVTGTFQEEIQKGLDELNAGKGIHYQSVEDLFADVRKRAKQRRAST